MTDNPFAALLRDVPRRVIEDGGDALYHGKRTTYLPETETLAALAAAVPADLAEAMWKPIQTAPRGGEWFMARSEHGQTRAVHYADEYDRFPISHDGVVWSTAPVEWMPLSAFPALLARIAAQEAQIKGLAMDVVSAGCQAQEAYEAQKAAEAERDALATEKFKMRDERDKAKIAASNYAEFNHTWRARAEAAETALAAMTKERDEALHFLDVAVDKSPKPLKALGKYLADLLDEDDWPTAERLLNGAVTTLAAEKARVAKLVEALKRWEHSGCPDCGGDCASANPPVSLCIMRETRAAITEASQ